jgi:ABC-type transport system substrate-binding protein
MAVDVTGGELIAKIFSGLLRVDKNLKIVPDLAQSYHREKDGLRWTFTLREDARFSDGSPVTSEDVVFSWKRVLAPQSLSPRKWVFENIAGAKNYSDGKTQNVEGLKIKDSKTLVVELEKPFATFPHLLTMPAASIVPQKLYANPNFDPAYTPLGSGPFTLKEWNPDVSVVLEPNLFYPSQNSVRASLTYLVIPEDASALSMLETGALDILKLPRQQLGALKARFQDHSFQEVQELNTYFIGFDHRKPYLDIAFRKAVAHLIQRELWTKTLLGGQGEAALSPVPGILLPQIVPPSLPEYSEEKAKMLFRQSAAFGRKIVFLISSSKENFPIAETLQAHLKTIGASVALKVLDWSAFKEALIKGEGDLFYLSWWGDYAHPENFLYPPFHSINQGAGGNRVYYKNPQMDTLLEIFQIETDEEKRKKILTDTFFLFTQDLPWVPLWHRKTVFAVSKRVGNFNAVPLYSMDKGVDWKINPEN